MRNKDPHVQTRRFIDCHDVPIQHEAAAIIVAESIAQQLCDPDTDPLSCLVDSTTIREVFAQPPHRTKMLALARFLDHNDCYLSAW